MKQEELLPLLCKKDQKAFAVLYGAYSKNLYLIIFDIMKDKEASEDLLQEAFVKIWKNIHSYSESRGRLFTWMARISRNLCFDRLSSKRHQNIRKEVSIENCFHIHDANTSVNSSLDAIGISEFVKRLQPHYIRLIELLYYKGYTQEEASKELAIPLGTVKTQNRICIRQLRLILKAGEYPICKRRITIFKLVKPKLNYPALTGNCY